MNNELENWQRRAIAEWRESNDRPTPAWDLLEGATLALFFAGWLFAVVCIALG